jgi:hypothetical protein
VLSSLQNAVRSFLYRPPRRIFLPLICFSLVLFAAPTLSAPHDTPSLDDAIRQLADRVAAIPNLGGPFRLQFVQDAAFASDTGKDWQESFSRDIEKHHLPLTEDPAANLLRVGLSETPTQLVLAASVRVVDKDEVRLVTSPRTAFRAANLPVAPIRIERQLVYQSPDRIFDASSLWNGAEGGMILLAFHNADLSVLRLDAAGQVLQTISLTAAGARLSRDPRGELTIRGNDVSALLPGKSCEFTWARSTETKCHSAKPVWRNPTVLTPSCGAVGWTLLADGSDWTTPDVLQVVPDGSTREGNAALLSDFPGPVFTINAEQNRASALVVTRNLRTGNYEVYKITLVCGN